MKQIVIKEIISFILLSLLYFQSASAQGGQFSWVKSSGGTAADGPGVLPSNTVEISPEGANNIAIDASGNTYIIGSFASTTIDFGTTTLTNSSIGAFDMFIAKYDPNGNLIWVKSGGGDDDDIARCVALDKSGNICIAGSFKSSTFTFETTVLNNVLWYDIYLLKLDSDGNLIWAKSYGGTSDDVAYCLATDNLDAIYIAGNFNSDEITFGSTTLTKGGKLDLFIVKHDKDGNILWVENSIGTEDNGIKGLAVDGLGNLYATGYFEGSTIKFDNITLTTYGNVDAFVVKFDYNGNALWANNVGGDQNDFGLGLTIDANGNVFVVGHFMSLFANFDTSKSLQNSEAGYFDMFVVKYDPTGIVKWAETTGGLNDDTALGICVDSYGNVYVIGNFVSQTIKFNPFTLNNQGYNDVFIARYDGPTGYLVWARRQGGSGDDAGRSIISDGNNNLYIAGSFKNSINFGAYNFTSKGHADMYLAKLSSSVSINENVQNYNLMVSPNPSINGQFKLKLNNLNNEDIKIQLYDALGKLISSEKIYSTNNLEYELNVQDKPTGLYLLEVIFESGPILTHKLIYY